MTTTPRHRLAQVALSGLALATIALGSERISHADQIPTDWQVHNMKAIGYSDLDGRGGAFKMAIKEANGRWYLYMGHLWHRGWSIVDVTDPASPQLVKFIPGPDNTFTIQVDLHDNLMLTAVQRIIPGWTDDPKKPFEEGVLLWDISDPVNPNQLSHWKTGGGGTHRNSYPGGQYAYLAAGMPGFRGNIFLILDVSDPGNPKETGRWWMPGQKEGETLSGPQPAFHGPAVISEDGNTAYLGYAPAAVILDISDKTAPKLIGKLATSPPFIAAGSQAVHSALKIPGKPLLFAASEASAEDCKDTLNHASIIDIKDPAKPRLMSIFPIPVPAKGQPYTDFCDKGGRFGPHNINHHWHSPDVEKTTDQIYLTYFNAGLRIYSIANPRLPKEVAWFIPPQPDKRVGPIPTGKLVTQTEDVLVDRRGNIYLTDKQWGLWVVRQTNRAPSTPSQAQ